MESPGGISFSKTNHILLERVCNYVLKLERTTFNILINGVINLRCNN